MTSRVLIIGGGIAGLATTIALNRLGISCRIFEKAAGPSEIGAGITLWSNAVLCLRALGVEDAVVQAGTPVITGELRDWRGGVLVRTPVQEVSRETGAPSIAIHRATLVDILTAAAGREAIEYGATCTAVTQAPDSISARFSDGRQETGDVLIGADGLRSAVLADLFGSVALRYTGHTCFRGVTEVRDDRLLPGCAFESWAPRTRFGAMRLSDEKVYWFANLDSRMGWTPENEQRFLLDTFKTWHVPIPQLIEATNPKTILQHDIFDRPPRREHWGRGRATLVGDACHPMAPNLGQGGCQALEDAVAIANALHRCSDPVTALRNYESLRYPRAASLVKQSWRQGWISQRPTSVECNIRNFCTRLVPASMMTNVFRKLITVEPSQLGGD